MYNYHNNNHHYQIQQTYFQQSQQQQQYDYRDKYQTQKQQEQDYESLNSIRIHCDDLSLDYLQLDPIDRVVHRVADQRDAIQKKTFTKWINKYLNKYGTHINDLFIDLRDGTKLILLLEILSKRPLPIEKGLLRFHAIQNVKACLELLKQYKIKLVNIHADEIVDGNPKLTLGLIWIIILYFQIINHIDYISNDRHIFDLKITNINLNDAEVLKAHDTLLKWVQKHLDGYTDIVCKNFSSCWRDGRILLIILHRHRPNKISLDNIYQRSNRENLQIAFNFAESEFGVTKILDPEDIDSDIIDEKSVITYVSMLYNSMPSIPIFSPQIQAESEKRSSLDDYAITSRSLIRWIKDSITTMSVEEIPKDILEIKTALNDVKSFQLDEYTLRLKEKKKLIRLYADLTRLCNGNIPIDSEHDIKTIEKLWEKLDSLIQKRENSLEQAYKKQDHLQGIILKINKLYENCLKKFHQIEQSFKETLEKRNTMTSTQININYERLDEQLKLCDEDVRKMFLENQRLKDEGHNEANILHKKISEVQSRIVELRSKFYNELKSPPRKSLTLKSLQQPNPIEACSQWVQIKFRQLENVQLPADYDQIEKELAKQKQVLNEINNFKDRIDEAKAYIKGPVDGNIEDHKHDINEIEISFNLLYNRSMNRLKTLEQLRDYAKLVQIELNYINQKEEIEIGRDWSMPQKIDSFKLNVYKQDFDEELNNRFKTIETIIHKGDALIKEQHPASNIIKTYIQTLTDRWHWLQQLSYLLGVHLKHLNSLEKFNLKCKETENYLIETNEELINLCNKHNQTKSKIIFKNTTDRFDYDTFINELKDFLKKFTTYEINISNLFEMNKNIISFKMRHQKLVYPNNKCTCAVAYKKENFQLQQGEHCRIEDNSQKTKWKVANKNNQVDYVPSVCFVLDANDQDSLDISQKIKSQYENLRNLIENCIRQCKKEKILTEIEYFRDSLNYLYENHDYDSQIKNLKSQIDEFIKESSASACTEFLNTKSLNLINGTDQHADNDLEILIDAYKQCYQKYLEISHKIKQEDEEKQIAKKVTQLETKLNNLTENYKNFMQTNKLSNNYEYIENLIKKFQDFEHNQFKAFERECEELRRNKLAKINHLTSQYEVIRADSEAYSKSLNDVKLLVQLINTENKRISKIEAKLCDQSSVIETSTLAQLSNDIERLLVEIENIKNAMKTKQDENLLNQIMDLTDAIRANKAKLKHEVVNLNEILLHSDLLDKRFKELTVHLADREALLNQLLRTVEQYKKSKNIETNWLESIKYKANKLEQYEKQRDELLNQNYFENLKNSFDSNAQIYTDLGSEENKIEELNDIGVKLVQLLKRYNQLLNDYQKYLQSLQLNENFKLINNLPTIDIINQIRRELNQLNREYVNLLKEYNYKIKILTNNIAKTDQQISFHITFQNVEPLIEKYSKDLFERYELIDDFHQQIFTTTTTQQNQPQPQQQQPYYIQTHYLNDLMDINTINIEPHSFSYQQSPSISTVSTSSVKYYASKNDNIIETTINFPLSFIDAVNRKFIDLESGFFKDPNTGTFSLRLFDALQRNYLNAKSAYICDPNTKKCFYLNEAFYNNIINPQNRVVIDPTTTITLSDALKKGILKVGSHSTSFSNETQSMSVHYIKDPSTGEFIAPTEAIKRKLLDPYKGIFINPITGERLPISEAIKEGYVIVEIINDVSNSNNTSERTTDSNLISTNLIRETKSYHLLAVYDPIKNDEITIREAINRGILDRQRGLYIDPIKNTQLSISDAINKGLIRARVLMPPSEIPYESLISTNKFQENKTYTICGAIDPRTNKAIGLNQAIRDGIINTQNGTYINIISGQILTLNVAIERGLVITDRNKIAEQKKPVVNREIKTLTIELVKDLRTGRHVTVSEAMQSGLIDQQTLQYHNFVTNENYSLNKAYEKGLISGNYSDKYVNEINAQVNNYKTLYLIISVYDARTNQHLNLDQAIQKGLFDYENCIYKHPVTKEVFTLHEAMQRGLVDARPSNEYYDKKLPIGDFGIDKQIKSIRTKFRQDGTSVLQIDIESTQPTRGVYEIDEIEEYTIKPVKQQQPSHRTEYVIDHRDRTNSMHEYTQVIDINTVHRIPPTTQQQQHTKKETTQIDVPIGNMHHEKNTLILEINKEIGKNYKVERNEQIIDDTVDGKRVLHIDINGKKEIPERKLPTYMPYSEEIQRVETLIIDDVDSKKQKPVNIDGQIHAFKNELIIDSHEKVFKVEKKNKHKYLEINEDNRPAPKPVDKVIKIHSEVIEDTKQPIKSYISIDDSKKTTKHIEEVVFTTQIININDEKPKKPEKQIIRIEDEKTIDNRKLYEDYHDVGKVKRQPSEDEIHTETFEQIYYDTIIKNRIKQKAPSPPPPPPPPKKKDDDDEIRSDSWNEYYRKTNIITKPKEPKDIKEIPIQRTNIDDDDEDRLYEEWTEIYTITIRGNKYKITWVYDPLLNERIPLVDAINKGIIDLKSNSYHNVKTSHSITINEAIDDGLIGIEEDKNALHINVNGISYTIYWVWDPVTKRRISPKRAIDRGVLNLTNNYYRNYSNNETISIHEAILMKLIGASEDLSDIDEELLLTLNSHLYKISWVKDTRTGERVKPREALRRALLDLTRNTYKKHDTNDLLTILEAIERGFIGISSKDGASIDDDDDSLLKRQDSLLSLDDDELTIKTKTAIYVITGLLHPETQKEIKVSEAIELGILDKETGSYKDFKTNVVYEVGEAINEGIVFATVTDLLQDQTASTEVIREEIKRYIVKSVIDPRTKKKIGGLQAQAAGILNYAQGMYTNPDSKESIPIGEAIAKNLIIVQLQEESSNEEFDAEVITETLMERCITNYRIFGTGVLDPISHQMITGDEAVHKQIIDTETNSYVDAGEVIPLKDAIVQHKVNAQIHERIERKPLGLTLQNALRLGLFNPENGLFKDLYTNKQYKLPEAIERGHVNPNGPAVADSNKGMMTLNEAFTCGIFDRRDGVLNKTRLSMYKAKLVDSKIFKLNFEDAVKCGIINLKTGKYKHMQSEELLLLKDAINRGLIDGESTIIENPTTNTLMSLRKALEQVRINDHGEVVDPVTNKCIITLENAFNTRKIFSAFDENTGEIFLTSRGKIVPFEKAVRKNKMDKDVRIFEPKLNRDLTINDAIEHGILDKTSGMIIDPKGGSLLTIKEAVKRGIVSIAGAPVVTGHHDSETIEKPVITSRKHRHLLQPYDDDIDNAQNKSNKSSESLSNGTRRLSSSSKTRTVFESNDQLSTPSASIILTSPRTNTSIVYDIDPNTTASINEAKKYDSLITTNPNDVIVTKVTTSTEEHRKRIRDEGDIFDKIRKDFKETLLQPGAPAKVTASSNYEYETKSRIDSNNSTAATQTPSTQKQVAPEVESFVQSIIEKSIAKFQSSTPIKQQEQQQQHEINNNNTSVEYCLFNQTQAYSEDQLFQSLVENKSDFIKVNFSSDDISCNKPTIMRQVSILEVYDPFTNTFISVSDAVKKGIFNESTYQYNDYVNNKTYTITDAAKRGFFKTEVNNDPESLIVEKLRVTQTFEIVNIIDPFNENYKINVDIAIKKGYIDLVKNIYFNPVTQKTLSLNDAIEEGLVEVRLMNESFEKIKEKFVEKSERKNVETITTIEEDKPVLAERKKGDTNSVVAPKQKESSVFLERLAVVDKKAKKEIKASSHRKNLPSALVKDLKSNRLIDIDEAIKLGIFNEETALYYDEVDLNKAIEHGHIILPDSDYIVDNIEYVKDIKADRDVTIDLACERGIIDKGRKLFKNTKSNKYLTLYEALHRGYLVLYDQDGGNEDEPELTVKDISSVFNPNTGEQVTVDEAIRLGLLNKRLNAYIEPKTKRMMKLNEAVSKGLACLNRTDENDEVMAIKAVYNPLNGEVIFLKDAIDRGIIDYTEGTFKVPTTNEVLAMNEAYERGYLITSLTHIGKQEINEQPEELSLKISSRKSSLASEPEPVQIKPIEKKPDIIETKTDAKKYASLQKLESIDAIEIQPSDTFPGTYSEIHHDDTIFTHNDEDQVFEKVSSPKKKGLLQMLRTKMFGSKKPQPLIKSGVLDEATIADSLIFIDTKTHKEYDLRKAINKFYILNPNTIVDTKRNSNLTLCDALSRSVIYFDIDETVRISKIDNSFYDAQNLYIIYYINEPQTKKKLSLVDAIRKGYLNKYNTTFTDKQTMMSLSDAIDKGHVTGAIIRLKTLAEVIRGAINDNSERISIKSEAPGGQKRGKSPSLSGRSESSKRAPKISQNPKAFSLDESMLDSADESIPAASSLVAYKTVPNKVLEKAGKKFDKKKQHIIEKVYDPVSETNISYDEAVKKRLLNPKSHDYTDPFTGKTYNLARSIQKGYVTVIEFNPVPSSPSLSLRSGPVQKSSTPRPDSSLDRPQATPEVKKIKALKTSQSLDASTYEDTHRINTTDLKSFINDTFKNVDVEINNNKRIEEFLQKNEHVDVKPEILANIVPKIEAQKRFVILTAYDTIAKKDIDIKEAIKLGIYDPFNDQYYDAKIKKFYSLENAVRNNKVRIEHYNNAAKVDAKQSKTPVNEEPAHTEGAKSLEAVDEKHDLQTENQFEGNFGVIKYIIYFLAAEKRYIKFEEVIERDLYIPETGKIIDSETVEEYTFYEALSRGLLKLNNSNFLYDRTHLYFVESVLTNDDKRVNLSNAVDREKIINRDLCTYRYKKSTYFIQPAMKEGFIEGRIIDEVVLKMLLEDFYKKVKETKELKHKQRLLDKMANLKLIEPLNKKSDEPIKARSYTVTQMEEVKEVIKPEKLEDNHSDHHGEDFESKIETIVINSAPDVKTEVKIATKSEIKSETKAEKVQTLNRARSPVNDEIPKNNFDNFHIIDPDTLSYISIHDALKKGLIDLKTGEIKDFHTLNMISIKQVITKGGISIDISHDQPYYHRSSLFVHNRSSYIIDTIYDPKTKEKYGIQDAIKHGLFANGIYRNPINGSAYQIDEAIESGFIIGKKVYLNTIETDFIEYLKSPPPKPSRGLYIGNSADKENDHDTTVFSEDFDDDTKPKLKTPNIGKIVGVRDLRTGKCYKPSEAEKLNLINIPQGWFRNSNTMEILQISDAIDQGFILLETLGAEKKEKRPISPPAIQAVPLISPRKKEARLRSKSSTANSRRASKVSSEFNVEVGEERKNNNEFVITSIVDPLNKVELSVDEAVEKGLFDINIGMYNDPISKKKLTMVDAIDVGYIKIAHNMHTSYKVTIEKADQIGNKVQKSIKTYSIRYIVDTESGYIRPINEAIKSGIVNIDDGTLVDTKYQNVMNLQDAYDRCLALTIDDIDNSLSTRCEFKVELVRNIKTGKEMHLKSALAKNWISLDRRIYYNKYSKEEIPMSQAIDMNLIAIRSTNYENYIRNRSRSQDKSQNNKLEVFKRRNLSESDNSSQKASNMDDSFSSTTNKNLKRK